MSNSDWFNDFMDMKLPGGADASEEQHPPQNGGCLPVILGVLLSELFQIFLEDPKTKICKPAA